MAAFAAARFFSERQEDISDRFDKHACAVEDLPQQISTLRSGENIMIKAAGIPAESHEQGSAAYGQLVFWTAYTSMDQAWQILKSQFLSGSPQAAVAIAARKQKPNWYIEESRRPLGDCRLSVFIPASDARQQRQVAGQVADMLGTVNISHIFYVSNTQVMRTASVPAAARLTQPVYESPSHHLVYVQPLNQHQRPLSAITCHLKHRDDWSS